MRFPITNQDITLVVISAILVAIPTEYLANP